MQHGIRQENTLTESWRYPVISVGNCRGASGSLLPAAVPAQPQSCTLRSPGWGLTLAKEGPGHLPRLLKTLSWGIKADSIQIRAFHQPGFPPGRRSYDCIDLDVKLKPFKQVTARQLGAPMRWKRLSLFADKLCMCFHFTQLLLLVYLVNKRQQSALYSRANSRAESAQRRAFVKHLLALWC